ncbi:hypothetical protein [Gloeobacter violaceus]|uniref:Gll0919 protein n=1 Tax=Gloeobacter violaceus (strain ATCC 29082 / PCC 7421) TaxID=251221 RepID=Q7NM50_GLOVI|nr:hypothetical protein [Gloeobacter violaceus]BAC88860.1 gll0919 [Gloeobacter violaceus PCC 7421]
MRRIRNRRGFTLVLVLLLGAILLVVGTTVFSVSVNNSRATTGERARTEAYLSAESALTHVRSRMGRQLLSMNDRGEAVFAEDTGPFGLYRRDGKFYLGYAKLSFDGTVLGMHDLMSAEPLPDTFEATALKEGTPNQRWWVHQLGAVRWIPLSVAEAVEGGGLLPVAARQVEVVGESGGDGSDGRQAVAQTLRLAVDLNAQAVTRRPEVALGVVSVAKVNPEPLPPFSLKVAQEQPSRIRIEGPVLVDTPKVEGDWARLEGQAKFTVTAPRNPDTGSSYGESTDGTPARPLNPDLFKFANDKEKTILSQGGDRRFARPGKIDLEADFESFEESESPGTLQLTVPLAELIGQAGTTFRKDFNDANNILNPRGETIYDAKKAEFDFNKARRGIFYLPDRTLLLRGQPFKVFTYKGRGTLVITSSSSCLSLENAGLVPLGASDSLTIVCALKPPDPKAQAAAGAAGTGASTPGGSTTPSTPAGSTLPGAPVPPGGASGLGGSTTGRPGQPNAPPAGPPPKPPAIKMSFSSGIPVTVLANARGIPLTVERKDLERDIGAPPNLPTTLRRLISSVTVDGISIPSGARAVTLDRRNYILARLSERDAPEVLVSIGVNSRGQQGSLQRESVRGEAQVVPLMRLQAQIFSNGPFLSEGSARLVGSLIAPAIAIGPPRYAPNTQNLLYGDNSYGLRVQFDAIYRRTPPTVGAQLMTFRPRQRPEPFVPVPVARVDGALWQRFNFDQWRTPPASTPAETTETTETTSSTGML